ncbi:hypothetical protein JCM10295v2_006290 [Rhodotorula toruloides]
MTRSESRQGEARNDARPHALLALPCLQRQRQRRAPTLEVVVDVPAKCARGKGNATGRGGDADVNAAKGERGLDADGLLARRLQEEEEEETAAKDGAGPSTSAARRKSRRKPSTTTSALASSTSSASQLSADPNDPQIILEPHKKLLVGGGTCGNGKAGRAVLERGSCPRSLFDTRLFPRSHNYDMPVLLSALDKTYLTDHLRRPTPSINPSTTKRKLTAAKPRKSAHDLARDRLYLVAFQILSSLLPSPDSPTPETYDFLPSPLLSALVELSTLPDVLTQLLRNDSVTEWQRRSDSPGHSPYAYGLFEFDIFLPLQYPPVNPVCWLKTTGGKKVRFNPNLYAEGKICLSLLGTWSGASEEMSQPGQSTIVQVLLSISLMISGQLPSKNCSLATACWANLNWIKDGKFKASIWSDIIVLHFLLERSKLASTL